jgi:dUTPase
MTTDKLIRLIWMQQNLQREFGFDFKTMPQEERIACIRDQHQAAIVEFNEVLDEVDWKPWTSNPNRQIRREAYIGELIDVLHFWVNMVLVVSGKMTAEEIADEIFTRYAMKNRINSRRRHDGYDGRSTKCGGCGRALDDVAVECTKVGDQGYCAQTNSDINYVSSGSEPKSVIINPVVRCPHCDQYTREMQCRLPTPDTWGWCGTAERNLRPVKLPVT